MRRWSQERGQTAVEYLGMLLVVSVIIAALASTDVGTQLSGQISRKVCEIANGTEIGCGGTKHTARPAAHTRVTAHAASVPCDGLSADRCSALRAMMARALADHQEAVDSYIQYATDFAYWVAAGEGVTRVTDVIRRPGLIKAVNMLLRKEVNREGARLITAVRSKPLIAAISKNYSYGARIGKGSTADALRDEVARGVKYGAPKSHYKKAQQGIRELNKILGKEQLDARERQIATNIRGELWQNLPSSLRPKLR